MPELPDAVAAGDLTVSAGIRIEQYDHALSGSADRRDDYSVRKRIDHADWMTIEESEQMMADMWLRNWPATVLIPKRA